MFVKPAPSLFPVGTEGSYRGTRFVIAGLVQLANQDSAAWDECRLVFDDGRSGWLAHAQGRLLVSFETPIPVGFLPSFEDLRLNEAVPLIPNGSPLYVIDKGQARVQGVQGDVPAPITCGEVYPYADLANMDGDFASVDWSRESPTVYMGREVTRADLGMRLSPSAGNVVTTATCTACQASITIRNPGRSGRVTCPSCRALFDVATGGPKFIADQAVPSARPSIPIGTLGHFAESDWTVIGFMRRSTTDEDGQTWFWEEYLLSDARGDYRWLANSDNHWTLSKMITVGGAIKPTVRYHDQHYKLFRQAPAQIVYLEGEFYWNVNPTQVTDTAEFISPPQMLTVEFYNRGSTGGEAAWTHGVYLSPGEVERAFGMRGLPQPKTVGPHQPFRHKGVYAVWGWTCLLAIFAYFLLSSMIQPETIFEKHLSISPPGVEQVEKETIEVRAGRNLRVTVRADIRSTWLHLTGNLVDEETLMVQPFEVPLEHWSGVEDGERWSEGDTEAVVDLSALPAGRYVLALHVERDPALSAPAANPTGLDPPAANGFEVRIEQGHIRFKHLLLVLVLLSIVPAIVGFMQLSFESSRWEDSNVGGRK